MSTFAALSAGELREFRRVAALLPDASLSLLHDLVSEAQTRQAIIDPTAVARALLRQAIVPMPPLPKRYAAIEAAGGGRRYELLLNVDPTDRRAVRRTRARYLRECRLVLAAVRNGTPLVEAWAAIRKKDKSRRE